MPDCWRGGGAGLRHSEGDLLHTARKHNKGVVSSQHLLHPYGRYLIHISIHFAKHFQDDCVIVCTCTFVCAFVGVYLVRCSLSLKAPPGHFNYFRGTQN